MVLALGVAVLGVVKVWRPRPDVELRLTIAPVAALLALTLWSLRVLSRRRPPLEGALALDRHYGLKSGITNALSFAQEDCTRRTPLKELTIREALAVDPGQLSSRDVCPLRRPPYVGLSAALILVLAVVSLLEGRTEGVQPPRPSAPPFDALVVNDDDLNLFRHWTDELERAQGGRTLTSAHQFNRLVEDLAERRLDLREALRRVDALEQSLQQGAEVERAAFDKTLDRIAEQLGSSSLGKPVATHLAERRLDDAAEALEELAKSLKSAKPPSRAELARLRESLQAASDAQHQHLKALAGRQSEMEQRRKRLLDKRRREGQLAPSELEELRSIERQHRRLRRDRASSEQARKRLSRLEQELARAARDLMKDLGMSAADLNAGAENLRDAARQRMSQEQQQQVLERLRQLREVLRHQGRPGQERFERLKRFSQRARGASGKGRPEGRAGEPGTGAAGRQSTTAGVTLGQGAPFVPVPMTMGPDPGAGDPAVQEQDGASSAAGHAQGPEVGGEATDRDDLQTRDVSAVAQDTGQGSASSEVIQGAAERGFVGRDYRDVYVAYEGVAERALERDEIPPGYRHHVQRYFQLIRPRE